MNETKVARTTLSDYKGLSYVSERDKVVEIERRDEVVQIAKKGNATIIPQQPSQINKTLDSFEDKSQDQVVHNLSHIGQRPKQEFPAFRLLGAYNNDKSATAYIQEVAAKIPCNMYMSKMRQWVLICKTMERQLDTEYCKRKVEELKGLYQQDVMKRQKEFKENKEAQKMGSTNWSIEHQKQQTDKKKKKKLSSRIQAMRQSKKQKEKEKQKEHGKDNPSASVKVAIPGVDEVPQELIRRKMDYAVVSIMKDITPAALQGSDAPEPAFIVWRFFPTYELAKEWMSGVGAIYILNYPTDAVDAWEWLYPENVDMNLVQEAWRNPEQNKIMMHKKSEPAKVAEFEQWCKSENLEPKVTEVVGNLEYNPLLPDEKDTNAINNENHNEISLPPKTFDVVKIETKNPETEKVTVVVDDGDKDYEYIRKKISKPSPPVHSLP